MSIRLFLAALCLLLPMAAPVAQDAAPVEGRDYVVIPEGAPWQPREDAIEVAEVFAYTCGHCASFQPMLDAWRRKAPADVHVVYVPAAFNFNDAYARGFFAAEALGELGLLHNATFDAIHRNYSLPPRAATLDEFAGFAQSLGLDRARFRAAMAGPETDARMRAARDFAMRSGIEGTPTVIVAGRYRVQGRSLSDILRIAEQLIARERAAR